MADIKLTSKFVDVGTRTASNGTFWGYQDSLFGSGNEIGTLSETANGASNVTTSNLYSTTVTIKAVYWQNYIVDILWIWMAGNHPNSGWDEIQINGNIFTRASATYAISGANTYWYWSTSTNPFGTTAGADIPVDIVIDYPTTHGGTVSPTSLTSSETTTTVYTLSSAQSTKYRIIKETGTTPSVSDGGTVDSRTGNGTINIPTSAQPVAGVTATYQVQIGGPYSQTSDNDAWIDTTGTNNSFSITRAAAITAPVVNNTQTFSSAVNQNISHSISLTSTGSGGTLEYNKSTTTTVPTTGWQTSSTVTLTRGTSYYLWARQGVGYEDRTDTALLVPYIQPDATITPVENRTILNNATVYVPIVGGDTATTTYEVRTGSYTGTPVGSRVGNGLITVSSPPANNSSQTYYLNAYVSTAKGGNEVRTNIQSFTVTRAAAPATGITPELDIIAAQTNGAWNSRTVNVADFANKRCRLVFVYKDGGSFTADIQLDNIQVDAVNYSFENTGHSWQTSTSSAGLGEYETASYALLGVGTTLQRWNVDTGGTGSGGTGRTDAASGIYYVYAESSNSVNSYNKEFILRSTVIDLDSLPNLSYSEARLGATIGILQVYLELAPTNPTSISYSYASTTSPTTTVTLTASGGEGGDLQVSVDNVNWYANGTAISVTRGTGYSYRARRVKTDSGGSIASDTVILAADTVPYLPPANITGFPYSVPASSTTALSAQIFSGVQTEEKYAVSLTTGLASANVVANSLDVMDPYAGGNFTIPNANLPSPGTTGTYYLYAARFTTYGGDGAWDEVGSFTVARGPTDPTALTFSAATTGSPSTSVTVTASGGTGGDLQVSENGTTWVANGSSFSSKTRGTTYTFYGRRYYAFIPSNTYSDTFNVPYLDADTTVTATSSVITSGATSATTTVGSVARASEEVAVRLNNGSVNLGTRLGNGVISFTDSLPSFGEVTTYEIFTRRDTTSGGDGTTWYATDDTFTVERTPTPPTGITALTFSSYTELASVSATATGGSGGTAQVSIDNSTWYNSPYTFTDLTRNQAYTFYARRIGDGTSVSATYTRPAYTVPYQNPFLTGYVITPSSQGIGATATSVDLTITPGIGSQDIAIRTINGSVNIDTELAPGTVQDVTLTVSNTYLPRQGETVLYEVFVRLPLAAGGDGTTWYDTNSTASISRQGSILISPPDPISILHLRTFFGNATGTLTAQSITDYYQGSLPNLPENSGVPASGTISLSQFYDTESDTPPTEWGRASYINGGTIVRDSSIFTGNNVNFVFVASNFKDNLVPGGTWRIFYRNATDSFDIERYIDHVTPTPPTSDFTVGDVLGTPSVIFGGTLSTANATAIRAYYNTPTGGFSIPQGYILMYRKTA